MVDELASPLGYSSAWLVVLLALTALPVLVLLLRAAAAWRRRVLARPPAASTLQARYLAEIESIRARHQRDELGDREAHGLLSRSVRAFAAASSGPTTDAMTLSELESSGADPRLVDAVHGFYDGAFHANPTKTVTSSVEAALKVVTEWS